MEQPNYYAVIPAIVRYDNELKANEKLLYGEISALAQKDGTCWANNGYFAKLYDVSNETISRWLKHLKDKGYITLEIVYKNGTKEIEKRLIGIDQKINTPCQNNQYPIDENVNTPIDENVKENNTSIEQYKINKKEIKKKKFIPPTLEEVETYVKDNELNVNAKDFVDYFEATNWVDAKGQKVISWKGKIRTWNSFKSRQRRDNMIEPTKQEDKWDMLEQAMNEGRIANDTG